MFYLIIIKRGRLLGRESMVKSKTPEQLAAEIKSLKKQVTSLENQKKALSVGIEINQKKKVMKK